MRTRYACGVPTGRRLPVMVAILVLVVACQATVETTTSTTETIAPPATSTTVAATSTTTIPAPPTTPDEPNPGRVLRMGLERDIPTDNYWAYLCRDAEDVQAFVLGSTRPSFYELAMPGINIVPDLAANPQPPHRIHFPDLQPAAHVHSFRERGISSPATKNSRPGKKDRWCRHFDSRLAG